MGYFKTMISIAKTLSDIATKERDNQDEFRESLEVTLTGIKKVEESVNDDELWMDAELALEYFVGEFTNLLIELDKECDRAMRSTDKRKRQLRQAILRAK